MQTLTAISPPVTGCDQELKFNKMHDHKCQYYHLFFLTVYNYPNFLIDIFALGVLIDRKSNMTQQWCWASSNAAWQQGGREFCHSATL